VILAIYQLFMAFNLQSSSLLSQFSTFLGLQCSQLVMTKRRRKSVDNSDHATEDSFKLAIDKLKAWRRKDKEQGVMDQILPGLYLGGKYFMNILWLTSVL
jgi:hypothetical protein